MISVKVQQIANACGESRAFENTLCEITASYSNGLTVLMA